MTITALTGLVAEWFTPESQKGEDSPARFKVKPLNGEEFCSVYPDIQWSSGSASIGGEAVKELLKNGLVDWEGIEDAEGKPLDCVPGNHKFLPGFVRIEVASHILTRSVMTEDAKKN